MGKNMNKKILMGSILAVVILILVSFTGVVGYQTTKSSTITKASPLFTVRSSRAIDEESKDLTCDYVGKEEKCLLSIPKLDSKNIQYQKGIDIIQNMDDKSFDRFVDLAIKILNSKHDLQEYKTVEIIQVINQYRDNPNMINQNPTKEDSTPSVVTHCGGCPEYTIYYPLGSCFFYILYFLWVMLNMIIEEIGWILATILSLTACKNFF